VNRNQLRALAADAFHQVLDNGVFRILAVLCVIPILFTFVVGIREEGVVLLFGLKSWSYSELFSTFGHRVLPSDPRGLLIEGVLQVVVEFLAGSLGMLVALSATSFFVPRLLEKGAAELYFHKPVSRTALFLSRYLAGLLFVALVSFVLVGGMALGLLLVSGHGDPGILVAPLTLTYAFAPIYAFTQLAGVVTRSTVAALLLSSFFFLFNGCVQQSWIAWQQNVNGPALHVERERDEADAKDEDPGGSKAAPVAEAQPTEKGGGSSLQGFLVGVLDTLHFALPKTTDADYLGQKLRRALARPLYRDEDSLVTIPRLPPGMEELAPGELGRLLESEPELRARCGEPAFGASKGGVSYSLWRRGAERSETRIGERVRTRVETASQAAKSLAESLEGRAGVRDLRRESERFGSGFGGGDIAGWLVAWHEGEGAAVRTRLALVFKGARDDALFTLLCGAPGELEPEAAASARNELASQLDIDETFAQAWYPSQLALDAPLRFNILFSIGSTLAFAAAMLVLGAWRLARIAF
jgi:ABC-type transport system involved in multi-copper enzyme maturation permease subunit